MSYEHYDKNEKFNNEEVSSIDKIFDAIYIITIPSRKNYVEEFAKSFKINYNLFNAILIKDLENIYDNRYNLKWGEIACASSHEAVLKLFINSDMETILILEDDNTHLQKCQIVNDDIICNVKTEDNEDNNKKTLSYINNYIYNSYKSLPDDWDIFYLGRCWDDCINHKYINNYIVKTTRTLCNNAIVYSRRGAKKILDKLNHPLRYPIDHIIANLSLDNTLNCYATIKPSFYQNRNELGSSIGNHDILPVCLGVPYINFKSYI
jgi:GR25 family glycosyltransferase involved in LPS biosynthesis